MIGALKKLILISRPISWVNTAYPFVIGYVLLANHTDFWVAIIGGLFFLIPYNLLMYGVNDIFDYESDCRNPRKGGIEGMREERALHPLIAAMSFLASAPFVLYLLSIGTALSNVTLLAVLILVVGYSAPPLRLKERPIIDSMTSSLHFVGPLLYATTLTQPTGDVLLTTGLVVAAFFCWGMASHASGAVQDIIPDREGSIDSIATLFGARLTIRLSIVLYLLAAAIIAFVPPYGVIISLSTLSYVINLLPYWHVSDQTSHTVNAAWRRFLWINYCVGALVSIIILWQTVYA